MTGEGALGASFIPVFAENLRDKPWQATVGFVQKTFWNLALLLGVIAVLGSLFSRQVVYAFTLFGGSRIPWDLAVLLNRIIFPCVLFIGLAALVSAVLNSFHVFALPSSTPIFFNLVLILCSCAFIYRPVMALAPVSLRTPAIALALGVMIGSALQLLVQLPALWKRGIHLQPAISFHDAEVRKVGRLMGPAFFGMGVYQVNFFVDRVFATSSRMPTGSITSLYIADRVMQLVLGSYAIAVSTALLPMLSHQVAAGKIGEMKRAFGFSIRIVSFITIPAAVGLILLRRPIIQVLFQHGHFTPGSTLLTANALLYYSLGLPAYAAIRLITPAFFSTQDTMTPARIGAYSLAANIVLNTLSLLFLYRWLSNGGPALASSLAAYFNFGLLFLVFRERFGHGDVPSFVASFGKIAASTLAMAAVSYECLRISNFESLHHFVSEAGLLAVLIVLSTGAYFGVAWLLRCEELSEFVFVLRQRGRGGEAVAGGL